MRKVALKLPCWLLCAVLVIEWSGAAAWLPSAAEARWANEPSAPARPRLALPAPAELASAGALSLPTPAPPMPASFDDLVARSEAILHAIPRVRYDLAARAQALGPGVDRAFRFVRDQIRFEAYPGVLRGADGAYTAHAANAWDRSLLLADLLKRQGIRTRLVAGRLPRPEAERLFARMFEPAPRPEADVASPAPVARPPGAETFEARLRARALRDYAAIRTALGDTLPARASPSREDVLREIEGHVWLQADVTGRWLDLDSAFGDATPGRAYATAERTFDEPPPATRQQMTVRVVVETLAGRALKTETALEFTAAAESLLDRQIFLTHVPGGGGGLGGAITGGIAGRDAWTPVLWVDGETRLGRPVAFAEGQVAVERGRPPRGGLGGLFGPGGALGAATEFVAEWLEFVIGFPDGRHDVTRRMLVDRAGTAWRQAGTFDRSALRPLPRDANGLTPPRDLHNIWFSAGPHNLAAYADALGSLSRWTAASASGPPDQPETATAPPSATLTFGEQVWPFAMMNFAFLIQTDHTIVPALNDSPVHRFYSDSPRIVLISTGPAPGVRGGAGSYLQYDLRRDHLRGLARDASGEAGVVERKIWFGMLQGALEHETALQYAVALGNDGSAVASTSALLTGDGVRVFRAPAPAGPPLAANPETAARMAHALAKGAVLIVPRRALADSGPGWWEISADGSDTRAVFGADLNGARVGFPCWPPECWQFRPIPGDAVKPLPPQATPPEGPGWSPPGGRGGGRGPFNWKIPKGKPKVVRPGPMSPGGTMVARCRASGSEYMGVTGCVSVPAVGAAGSTVPLWLELGIYGGMLAVLGYFLGPLLM